MRAILLVLALASTSMAGCVLPVLEDDPASAGPQPIVKKAVLTIDPTNQNEADSLEDFLDVRFEYTHMGAPVTSADVEVTYAAANGQTRTRPLSTFTTKATLGDGDVVVIPAANITSGLLVRHGPATLAERGALAKPWFVIDGAPVPFSVSQPGQAVYRLSSSAGFTASGENFDAGETHVNRMSASLKGAVTGDLTVTTSRPANDGPRVDVVVKVNPTLEVDVSASLTDSQGTYEAGVKTADMKGEFDARAGLQFNPGRELRRSGSGFDAEFDGRVHMWDREHPKSQNYEPEDIDHPIFKESAAYEEHDVSPSASPEEAWVVEFLSRLWSAKVGVGDDYRIHVNLDFDPGGVSYDVIIQVTAAEPRVVGGKPYSTFRVAQTANLLVDAGASDTTYDVAKATYWVDQDSNLPVYAQGKYVRNFQRADVVKLLEALGENAPVSVPATVGLALQGDQTLELRSMTGDLVVSPIAGLLFANPSDFGSGMPWLVAMMFISGASSRQVDYGPPTIWMSPDEVNDRLTVSSASEEADWSRLDLLANRNWAFRLNGGAKVDVGADQWQRVRQTPLAPQAGDVLQVCVAGPASAPLQVTARDNPTSTILSVYSFESVDPTC